MFISSTKLNIIYSLIAFGSESKPKVPRGTSCTAGRPSSVGSFQPNKRFRFDIFRLDVIFTEWRSVWFVSTLNQRSAEKIRPEGSPSSFVPHSSGFDYADDYVNLKTLFSLIFIDYPTILFIPHVRSAQDDRWSMSAPFVMRAEGSPRRLWWERKCVCAVQI